MTRKLDREPTPASDADLRAATGGVTYDGPPSVTVGKPITTLELAVAPRPANDWLHAALPAGVFGPSRHGWGGHR